MIARRQICQRRRIGRGVQHPALSRQGSSLDHLGGAVDDEVSASVLASLAATIVKPGASQAIATSRPVTSSLSAGETIRIAPSVSGVDCAAACPNVMPAIASAAAMAVARNQAPFRPNVFVLIIPSTDATKDQTPVGT